MPAGAIVLEQRATNTYENVTFVDEILRDHRWTSILLVSSPYHMRRALLVWHKVGAGDRGRPAPPASRASSTTTRAARRSSRSAASLQEYLAMFAYWRRGWL